MNKQIMIAALAIMLTARLGTITYNDHRETWDLHLFGSIIETSRGTGIVLDTHTADRAVVDIATDWKE